MTHQFADDVFTVRSEYNTDRTVSFNGRVDSENDMLVELRTESDGASQHAFIRWSDLDALINHLANVRSTGPHNGITNHPFNVNDPGPVNVPRTPIATVPELKAHLDQQILSWEAAHASIQRISVHKTEPDYDRGKREGLADMTAVLLRELRTVRDTVRGRA